MSISSGWNDPPVLAAKKSEVHSQVAEIHWKPAAVDEYAGFNALRAPVQPSPKPVEPEPQPAYTLSEADNYLVATISALVANIRQLNKTPVNLFAFRYLLLHFGGIRIFVYGLFVKRLMRHKTGCQERDCADVLFKVCFISQFALCLYLEDICSFRSQKILF